ncbi:MAG: GH3 auxin-responsive promoter family protein [Myxococcota bacterium]
MFASKTAESFIAGLAEPEATQSAVLNDAIVGPNVGAEFGVEHGFSRIQTLADYRAAVPIRKYAELAPWIDRVVAGEQGVLTTERVKRFFMTSGSTSKAKYIPVTRSFIQTKSRAFGIYWAQVFGEHPKAKAGRMVTNFSDSGKASRAPGSNLPCGSESSYWAAVTRATQLSTKPIIPKAAAQGADSDSRYYTLARILLEESFSVIMTLNPSTILLLFKKLEAFAEELAADVERGGLGARPEVSDEVRTYVADTYRGNPERAAQIRDLAAADGRLLAGALWPDLSLAICWRSPMLRPYLELLAPHFGTRVAQRDYLMMASEGVMALPMHDGASGGVCAVGMHLYEFVPESEYEDTAPTVLSPHELEVGGHYVVILSNGSGLYRYDIGDVVRVTGFLERTPTFEFLYRAGRTCSLTGEKLTEAQVSDAVDATVRTLRTPVVSFTVAPAKEGFPRYVALVEFQEGADPAALAGFPAAFDEALTRSNGEYGGKRSSQRLAAPELWVVAPGSFEAVRRSLAVGTTSDSQIKPTHLSRDPSTADRFDVRQRIVAS